jgi:hypothetical protein
VAPRLCSDMQQSYGNYDEIRNLAAGPLFTVTRYEGMDINGYTFYTMT